MSRKSGAPSRLGITKTSGMCIACGKPRASVVIVRMGRPMWIHAKCSNAPTRTIVIDDSKWSEAK